jgi:hypothetical protein
MIVARHEVPGKRPSKETSRRVRYDRALLIPEVFLVESAFRNDVRTEVRTSARIRPYPTGRLFWGGDFQALHAWLRSHCPSGTKAIRPREASLS